MSAPLRRAVPLLLLGLALVVAAAGAVGAHRAQTGHRAAAEALLRDYGAFAAWSFHQAASEILHDAGHQALYPPRNELYPVRRGGREAASPEPLLARLLAEAGEGSSCGCRTPVAGDFAFLVPVDGTEESVFVGTPPAAEGRDALIRHVRSRVGSGSGEGPGHGLLVVENGAGGHRIAGWARLRGPRGAYVYGLEFDSAAISGLLHEAFTDRALLPSSLTRGRENGELLALTLENRDGAVLYASRPATDLAAAGSPISRNVAGGVVVRASVLPEVADQLVIGGLPRSQVPWLLLLFGLAGLLAALAVSYLRRENRLARERTDFVASVSHELRTPLAEIRLFVETLRLGRTENEEQRAWALETVDRESLRLTRLVENILRFSRTEKGVRVHPEPVDVAEETAAVVEDFRPLIPSGAAVLDLDVDPTLLAEADRDAFRQILLNFLDNAVKYGPRGQTIRIRGEARGEHARISVADEGRGVPPNERIRIWESFRRGRGAEGSTATGSGIGLAVVRALVVAQEGRSWVEDAEGGGARFVVELPRVRTVRSDRLEGGTGGFSAEPERRSSAEREKREAGAA